MSLGSTGACSRPRRSVRSRSRSVLRSGSPSVSDAPARTFTCASVLSARASISLRRTRDASGSAITMRSTRSFAHTDSRSWVVPSTRKRADRAADEAGVVVDEADDLRVAERACFELERERDARVGRADDQGAEPCGLAVTLAFEGEEARLEADAAAPEQDQQRRDRRRGEERQRRVLDVGDPRQREGGCERTDRHRGRRRAPLRRPTRIATPVRTDPSPG